MKKYIEKHKKHFVISGVALFSLGIVVGAYLINPYAPILGTLSGLLYILAHKKVKV